MQIKTSAEKSLKKPSMSGPGSSKEAVAQLQDLLKKAGFPISVSDGIYGPQTERAVAAFQEKAGLKPSGVADANTLELLYKMISSEHIIINEPVKKGPGPKKTKPTDPEKNTGKSDKSPVNHWIFQAKPERYDLSKRLQPGETIPWIASRYRGKMKKNDIVYYWQSGTAAAIYGQGHIVSESSYETADGWRIDVACDARFDIPFPKQRMMEDKILQDMQIIKSPQGTNFSILPEQADLLRKRLESVPVGKQGFFLTNKAMEDIWTSDDKLGYDLYAQAIAIPILENNTKPPITIAIQAPWGHGKTSLMRMIQKRFDPGFLKITGSPRKKEDATSFSDFFSLLRGKSITANMLEITENEIPTVWFNPLYYQEKEQVWAGLAHSMLSQLTARFKTNMKKEEFWLRLQMHRLNITAMRRDFHRMILEDFIPTGLIYGFAALGSGIIGALSSANALLSLSLFAAPILAAAAHFKNFLARAKENPLHGKFEKYVREPDYADKLGFLYLVDHDITCALELLAGKKPVAVFIDDLDRCSPDVVCEVILAINQFISLPGRNVIFILGMDTNMVAMALESVHHYAHNPSKAESPKTLRRTNNFGWQFMDKFIQVPFTIPRLSPAKARQFMTGLLSYETAPEKDKQNTFDMDAYDRQYQTIKTGEDIVELKKQLDDTAPVDSREQLMVKLSERASTVINDPGGVETEKLVALALKDLHFKPRAMKRFLNVVRLLRHIDIFLNPQKDLERSRNLVVRTALLVLNWPQFVRWLQDTDNWENIDDPTHSPIVQIETAVKKSKTLVQWERYVARLWPRRDEVSFLYDPQFFSFLKRITTDAPGLSDIRKAGFI